jgi:hypothetical protein
MGKYRLPGSLGLTWVQRIAGFTPLEVSCRAEEGGAGGVQHTYYV